MAAGTRPGWARLSPLESGLAARIGCPTEQASTLVSTRHARVRAPRGDEMLAVCLARKVVWSYELPGDGDAVFSGEPEVVGDNPEPAGIGIVPVGLDGADGDRGNELNLLDRKSTRLNSSHLGISYAV